MANDFKTMQTETLQHASVLWNYFKSFNFIEKSDAIVVCCSYDLRVCDYACQLLEKGVADQIVFSGNSGRWTSMIWDKPEADIFFDHAVSRGVDENRLIKEQKATNIGENIANSKFLLPNVKKVTFLTKPNTLLRVKLTVPIQWPGLSFTVSCPEIDFPNGISNIVGLFGLISEMVGDVDRINKYPGLGYQIDHVLPENIVSSCNYLKEKGFTHNT